MLTGVGDAWSKGKTVASSPVLLHAGGTLAAGRTAHAIADSAFADVVANLGGIHLELCEGAAEGVAVHAELICGLALIALVVGKDFEDVTLLELAHGIGVSDTGAVHLCDETVKFALQVCLAYTSKVWDRNSIVTLPGQFDPIGPTMLELCNAV